MFSGRKRITQNRLLLTLQPPLSSQLWHLSLHTLPQDTNTRSKLPPTTNNYPSTSSTTPELNSTSGEELPLTWVHYFHPPHSHPHYSNPRYSLHLIILTLVIHYHYSHIMLVQFKQSLARTIVLLSLPVRLWKVSLFDLSVKSFGCTWHAARWIGSPIFGIVVFISFILWLIRNVLIFMNGFEKNVNVRFTVALQIALNLHMVLRKHVNCYCSTQSFCKSFQTKHNWNESLHCWAAASFA